MLRPMRRTSRLTRLALSAALAAAFLAGLAFDHVASAARRSQAQPYRPLDVFSDVLAHVENSYVEEVDEKDLVYGAVDGMMARLDPHSMFMRPELYRQMRDDTSGEFDGLGLELTVKDGELTVISPVVESPGERAGIRPGDRILSIEGAPTREMTLGEATRRMKGAAGTKVTLEIMREGFTAPQKLILVRDRIRTQSVDVRVLDPARRYAYVRIRTFQERTDREPREGPRRRPGPAAAGSCAASSSTCATTPAASSTRRCGSPTLPLERGHRDDAGARAAQRRGRAGAREGHRAGVPARGPREQRDRERERGRRGRAPGPAARGDVLGTAYVRQGQRAARHRARRRLAG